MGADGVLIGGCHPGDCHYQEGNYKALRRYILLRRLLEEMGIEKERIRLEWISASEGEKVKKVMDEMIASLRKLGPLNLNDDMVAELEKSSKNAIEDLQAEFQGGVR